MEKATIFAAAQPEFDTFPRLIDALGLKIEKDMTVAIKVDFLQRCPAIVQPLFLALAQRGASPFLTDCSVPFGDALQSLNAAAMNGYVSGAPCVLADGVKGTDYDLIPVRGHHEFLAPLHFHLVTLLRVHGIQEFIVNNSPVGGLPVLHQDLRNLHGVILRCPPDDHFSLSFIHGSPPQFETACPQVSSNIPRNRWIRKDKPAFLVPPGNHPGLTQKGLLHIIKTNLWSHIHIRCFRQTRPVVL